MPRHRALALLALLPATAPAAEPRISPLSLTATVGPGYQPTDPDERGIWQGWTRLEEEIATSPLRVRDPALDAYLAAILTRLIGDAAKDVRVYVMRDVETNASMTPTGMMIVHTALLARVRNEAQLAAVLGHEAGHYLLRHSLAGWRDKKRKSAVGAFFSAGAGVMAGATAAYGGDPRSWIDLANSVNNGLVLSILAYDRTKEREADAYGIRLTHAAGYPCDAAAGFWHDTIGEQRASAVARGKRYRPTVSAYATHPANAEREADILASAREIEAVDPRPLAPAAAADWTRLVAARRPALIDEQVRLNDPGASLYLIAALARDGWTGPLHYYEGETYRLRGGIGDEERATAAYAAAVALPDAPAEAYRAAGYAALKAGRGPEGRQSLARYLALAPAAPDAAMVRFTLDQPERPATP